MRESSWLSNCLNFAYQTKEMRDPAIKLFGKEITLAEIGRAPVVSGGDERVVKTGDGKQGKEEDELENNKDLQLHNSPHPMDEEKTPHNPEDDPKTPPILEENGNENTLDFENNQNETNNSDQRSLKKPDKILPCPRCNSMDTKFCYYNNYNVNQPRHFCKGCQRYWTAGGTMRNVPVGAGRRKSKSSASHWTNGTVFSFGSETLNKNHIFRNGILKMGKENGSDCSSGSSMITNSNSIDRNNSNLNGFTAQVPCLQGFPWPYQGIPNPNFCPPGYSIPVYPIPYWNCGVPGAWPVPWIPNPCETSKNFPNPNPSSPLGKHLRNGELLNPIIPESRELAKPKDSESRILIPKTLRIDDPDGTAKSSIWATLGIKNDSISRNGLFKAFEQKGNGKINYVPETPTSIQANPAAISRSFNFQETA